MRRYVHLSKKMWRLRLYTIIWTEKRATVSTLDVGKGVRGSVVDVMVSYVGKWVILMVFIGYNYMYNAEYHLTIKKDMCNL